mmetsp:Transcript_16095/g.48349  ORF Transcript_16095/g.48349 Transcript_16095/m.48349 type:complete len:166 (-) Transcript_16095:27-524(-)
MVRIKKRGTTSKATRKASAKKPFFKKVQHDEAEMAKHWDFRKSRAHNMKRVGLAHDVNRAVGGLPGGTPSSQHVPQEVQLEFVDIPQNPDDLADVGRNERRLPMSEEKQAYVVRLAAKHGADVGAMMRDRRRNPQQHTEKKLRKMIALYEGLTDAQRRVPAPGSS